MSVFIAQTFKHLQRIDMACSHHQTNAQPNVDVVREMMSSKPGSSDVKKSHLLVSTLIGQVQFKSVRNSAAITT